MEAARHPEPPPELQQRDLPMVKKSGPWFRFHAIDRDPLYFGRQCRHRFDAPHAHCRTLGSLMESRNGTLLAHLLDGYDFGLIRE